MTDDVFDSMSPVEVEKMTQRLVFTDEPVGPIDTGPAAEPVLVPRSVKLPRELDRACKNRAESLGLSQSAYIRSLIERDIAERGTGTPRPSWVGDLLGVIARHEHDGNRRAS